MTETNVKFLGDDTYQILIRSDEVDCQTKGMSLVSILSTIPRTEVNQEDHVLMTVKSDKPQAQIKQILHELVT